MQGKFINKTKDSCTMSKGRLPGKGAARVIAAFIAVLALTMLALAGCAQRDTADPTGSVEDTPSSGTTVEKVTIGTMITEDFLPMWVAEQEGVFEQEGVQVELITFQSAQELSTALAAAEIDAAMTDPMVAATLTQGGAEVVLEWVTLGETAAQGRFGILASPESGVTSPADLAGKPIGIGSNTIIEYVVDGIMEQAGVPADQVVKEELKKIPVRYEMMASNQVAGAGLPASLLYLGEQTGMVLVADDTQGKNLSQSVMVFRTDFVASDEGAQALEKVRASWDKAVGLLAADPTAYRALLVEKASLPEVIAESYPISDYPLAKRPTSEVVEPVLEWMYEKGYLEVPLGYDSATGLFTK
jgi:NitT/TauT family transport system substrate-binding protein